MVFTCYTNYGVVLSGVAASRCPLCELLLQLRRLCSGLCCCHICRLSCCLRYQHPHVLSPLLDGTPRGEVGGHRKNIGWRLPLLTGSIPLAGLR